MAGLRTTLVRGLATGSFAAEGSDQHEQGTEELAGHYVILGDTHHLVEDELLTSPPDSYEAYGPGVPKTRGAKAGLDTMPCDVVSRWEIRGVPVFSVVGPITIARVPGVSG